MAIEIKLIKRHHLNKPDLWCPFFVCDICKEIITLSGNYEYEVFDDSSTGPVYFTHKKCSRILRHLMGNGKTIYSDELSKLPARLYTNFADTNVTEDSPLSMYLYTFGLKFQEETRGPGIYFLFEDEELVYIGQSKDVQTRLSNHHVYEKSHHQIKFASVSFDEDRRAIERALIVLLKPSLNVVYTR